MFGGDCGKPRVGRAGNNDRERRAKKHGGQGVHGGNNAEGAQIFAGVGAQRWAAVSAVGALTLRRCFWGRLGVLMFVSVTRCVRSAHGVVLSLLLFLPPIILRFGVSITYLTGHTSGIWQVCAPLARALAAHRIGWVFA